MEPSVERAGLWRLPPDRRTIDTPGIVRRPGVVRFVLANDSSVVVQLLTEKDWMWRTPDEIYRVRARWVEDQLEYLPPFGSWTELAVWRSRHFESEQGLWIFERPASNDLDQDDRRLLVSRSLHDYAIKAWDSIP
jgi:hypothetical protein